MSTATLLKRVRRHHPFLAAVLLVSAAGHAADSAAPSIYSCVDGAGKRLTSDRPIAECNAREQRVLNADGSVRRVLPPSPTPDERAEAEARDREVLALRVARQDAIRRDRNLLARFADEVAHARARQAALAEVRKELRASESRTVALQAERKRLGDEAEFYTGSKLPVKLKGQTDANEVALEAQRTLLQSQQLEIVRINKLFDLEIERLRKLWAGSQPGSMGALGAPATARPASAAAPR